MSRLLNAFAPRLKRVARAERAAGLPPRKSPCLSLRTMRYGLVLSVALLCLHIVSDSRYSARIHENLWQSDTSDNPPSALSDGPSFWEWNSRRVKQSRDRFQAACNDPSSSVERIVRIMEGWFVPPKSLDVSMPPSVESTFLPLVCNYTFLDFGSNIGDSLGKLIDSGIGRCRNDKVRYPKYSIDEGVVGRRAAKVANVLSKWAHDKMRSHAAKIGRPGKLDPEDYCFYGVEGNPLFTERLKRLEALVLQSVPRPLRYAHFYTESIGMKVDGPATLYLDTVNVNASYWGSSIYARHRDVQQSALQLADKAPVGVPVTGMRLSTLVQQTTLKQAGNHLMIKMDIEGAEIDVLGEAYDSGILCDYAKAGVQVDLVVEYHVNVQSLDETSWKAMDDRWKQVIIPGLKVCGVTVTDGSETAAM